MDDEKENKLSFPVTFWRNPYFRKAFVIMSNRTSPPPISAMSVLNEEQAILATMNASLHDHDTYESNVLRQATHQLAPKLTEQLGFPKDMSGLGTTDLPVLHAVLAEIRRKITNFNEMDQKELNLLHMKEQILLHQLYTVGADLPLRLHEERAAEQSRARQLLESKNKPSDTRQALLSFSSATTTASKDIHKHESTNQQVQRKRIPMMQHKRTGTKDDDNDNDSHHRSTISPEELIKLKQLREERRKRRANRRRQDEMSSRSSSSCSSSDIEFDEKDDEDADNSEQKSPMEKIKGTQYDNDLDDEGFKIPEKTIECPLCQQRIVIPEKSDMDAVLSQHMSLCDNTRPSRRVTRMRGETTANVETDFSEISHHTSRKRKKSNTSSSNNMVQKSTSINSTSNVAQQTALDDIDEANYEDRVDDWIDNGIRRMKKMKERDEFDAQPGVEEYPGGLLIPEWMNNRLFGYQREGLKFMWNLHQEQAGLILGDEMGLGKTVQAVSFIGAAASSRKLKSVLIVAPATMLQHWLSELAGMFKVLRSLLRILLSHLCFPLVWAPGIRRILIHTSGGEVDGLNRCISTQLLRKLAKWLKQARANRVNEPIDEEDWEALDPHSFCGTGYAIVTTYENLRRNSDIYISHDFSYVILDEAQKIKSPDAVRTKKKKMLYDYCRNVANNLIYVIFSPKDITLVCKRLRTPHRLAISGTPVQNDLRELWSLFDFVVPGRLGTLPAFEQEFAVPIKRGGYSNASPMQVQLAYRCAIMLRDLIGESR